MDRKTWFITGISSGLGKALAQAAMDDGDFVVGTFRQQAQADDFNRQYHPGGLALLMDVTRPGDIERVYQLVRERYGSIDVLVNNAGYGLAGAVEETSLDEAREIFEVNFFGVMNICQVFLPMFRQQQRGHIIQISSHGGFKAFAGFGLYNASKFALEGMSEALMQELLPLGVKLTIVEPGPFRTAFAGSSFRHALKTIDDYHATAGTFKQRIREVNGKQEGDPAKAARAIVTLAAEETPPLRLMLGTTALQSVRSKIESVQGDLNRCEDVAQQAVF